MNELLRVPGPSRPGRDESLVFFTTHLEEEEEEEESTLEGAASHS